MTVEMNIQAKQPVTNIEPWRHVIGLDAQVNDSYVLEQFAFVLS